jgi:hypothetical protein
MYLVDSTSPPINNRKWNLGRFGRMGLSPVRLPNLGAASSQSSQSWRHLSGRRMRGLGASGGDAGYCTYFAADGVTPESFDFSSSVAECSANGGSFTAALNTPSPVGTQNPSPVSSAGASNGRITTVPATTPSNNPLDYTSPQAAIAAGLPAAQVMAQWSAALARFPSPQAAISAGIPAGVVNQLWQQSQVNAVNASAASAASSAQLSSILPWAAGGLLLLVALDSGGGKKRR